MRKKMEKKFENGKFVENLQYEVAGRSNSSVGCLNCYTKSEVYELDNPEFFQTVSLHRSDKSVILRAGGGEYG